MLRSSQSRGEGATTAITGTVACRATRVIVLTLAATAVGGVLTVVKTAAGAALPDVFTVTATSSDIATN